MGDGEAGAFRTNSTITGNWKDYIYRDLAQNVDAIYRTNPSRSRGIAGHSMSRCGAVTLAMKYPSGFSVGLRIECVLLGNALSTAAKTKCGKATPVRTFRVEDTDAV